MVRAVLFDFGQTLVDSAHGFRTAEKQLQSRILSRLVNVDSDEFLTFYRQRRAERQHASDFSRKNLAVDLLQHFGRAVDPADVESWEDEYWQTVRGHTREFPEARGVLRKLHPSFRLGLVTNTQGQGRLGSHRLRDFPALMERFQVVVVAGEAGVPEKPDPSPFLTCLRQLECSSAEAVYVGDDWRIDMCGAQAAGMPAIWLQHQATHRRWPDAASDVPIIRSLDELLGFPLLSESES